MATWSDWFEQADSCLIDLGIKVNHEEDIMRLEQSGLPHFKKIVLNEFNEREIKLFFDKYKNVWVRLVNKEGKRKYKFNIKKYNELIAFIEDYPNHKIYLFENCDTLYGGNVITFDKVVIEMVKGEQDLVGKSKVPFFHGFVNEYGRLEFIESTSLDTKKVALNILNKLEISRNEYIKGYFEFLYSQKGKVYFIDYKLGF